MKLNCGINQTQ